MISTIKFNAWSLLFVIPFLQFAFAPSAGGAEFSAHPSITVSEEYTDNVFASRDNKRTDYITRVLPGIALKYNAPFWDWDIAYNYDYRYYARNSRKNDDTHDLLGKGFVKIIDDLFFLDISDTYRRVSLDVTRDRTQESLFLNQSDSNIITASPYFLFRPGRQTTVKTGYRYTNVWYRDPTAVDKREHTGFVTVTYDLSSRLSLSADYAFTQQNSVNAYKKHAPYLGIRYEYSDKSFVFAQGGYTWIDFEDGADFNKPYWYAGFNHSFDTLSVYFNAGVQYPEDPLTGVTKETNFKFGVDRATVSGTVGFSLYYSKYDGEQVVRTNKYGAGVTARHEITPKITGNLAFSAERYDDKNTGSYSRRFYVSPGLSYALPRNFTIALNYTFIDYYSPEVFTDNYRVNRVVLEARKTF
jgi:hypothetical protein